MGHVEDRWWRAGPEGERVPRARHGVGLRWRARYRDADGRQRSQSFARRRDAERFLALVRADVLGGSYVDPQLSRTPLRGMRSGGWLTWSSSGVSCLRRRSPGREDERTWLAAELHDGPIQRLTAVGYGFEEACLILGLKGPAERKPFLWAREETN